MWRSLAVVFLTIILCKSVILGFNLSPQPNLILHKPDQSSNLLKSKSSYFGFTLNLRPGGLIVGAPRANSTLPTQRDLREPGVIYKCNLNKDFCYAYNFDTEGNIKATFDGYSYQSTNKSEQWLGASMTGGNKDTDIFVVCASRLRAIIPNDSGLHGICYWVNGTTEEQPQGVQSIKPLRSAIAQVETEMVDSKKNEKNANATQHFLQLYAQMGLDVSIAPNSKEILMGIPGYYDWAGSVIRYQSEMVHNTEGLSRRDTDAGAWTPTFASQIVQYLKEYPFKYDSYFGYSISSGYYDSSDPHKLLYLSTAPQGDGQSGVAFIFDISVTGSKYSLDIKKTFRGEFGEYFGYKVVSEDINGDKKPDIIISAPMHSENKHYDVGAIYEFINLGNMQFKEKKILNPSKNTGRFGTSISLLGDINNDGYNDIAVGAPFEDNGVVYIFLGSRNGLREKPSQILKTGEVNAKLVYGKGNMFGHGISQGSDIDQNGFNDLAIGAPNSDSVYLYKAYPVVEPNVNIIATKEIQSGTSELDVKVCYIITTPSTKIQSQALQLKIEIDPLLKRAKFVENNSNTIHKQVTAKKQNTCDSYKVSVKAWDTQDIFKPIKISVFHEIVNKVPQSPQFCETCVASDPDLPSTTTHEIFYSTGCQGVCNADLKVIAADVPAHVIVGQSNSISIKYVISNSGETAYSPKITFNSTSDFKKVPSNCIPDNQNKKVMTCKLAASSSLLLRNGQKEEIIIQIDTSDLQNVSKLILKANATSSGNEKTPVDNYVENDISVQRETNIATTGTTDPQDLNLEKFSNKVNVKNVFEINNHGPSDIIKAHVVIQIPVAFGTKQIIDKNNITIGVVYNNDPVPFQVIQPVIKLKGEQVNAASISNRGMNGMDFDIDKVGYPLEHESAPAPDTEFHQPNLLTQRRRRRRETVAAGFFTGDDIAVKLSHERMVKNSIISGKYPVNRTVVFTCANPSIDCVKVNFTMHRWNVNNNAALQAIIRMQVNLDEINKILVEPFEFFIIENLVTVTAVNSVKGDIINVAPNFLLNVISKYQEYRTPWWVILLAVLGGLLLLTAITYGMYKWGFFKRNKPPELQATKGAPVAGTAAADEEIPLRDMNQKSE